MKNTEIFDVLVVYSNFAAKSASSLTENAPFRKSNHSQYNTAYEYFLKVCEKMKLRAAFTTTEDIIGAGKCSSFWVFKKNKWLKINKKGYSPLIFNKFSPINEQFRIITRKLYSHTVKPFNNRYLHKLFDDKQATYNALPTYSIPTVTLNTESDKTISLSLKAIEHLCAAHVNKSDFSKSIIVKDRNGAGGDKIYKLDDNFLLKIKSIVKRNKKTSFILQPFILFEMGYHHKDLMAATDIRLIYQAGKIIQSYIRTAKKDDFRCNEHQGGKVTYISAENLPDDVKKKSKEIVNTLNKKGGLFALDFIVSNNNNVYFLEGNINPGIYWGKNSKQDEFNTKKLIHLIVKSFSAKSIPIPKVTAKIKDIKPILFKSEILPKADIFTNIV